MTRVLTRAEFFGVNWYFQEMINGSSVDGWDMERQWERYQNAPSAYDRDRESAWQEALTHVIGGES